MLAYSYMQRIYANHVNIHALCNTNGWEGTQHHRTDDATTPPPPQYKHVSNFSTTKMWDQNFGLWIRKWKSLAKFSFLATLCEFICMERAPSVNPQILDSVSQTDSKKYSFWYYDVGIFDICSICFICV